jgi:hypothetical protein
MEDLVEECIKGITELMGDSSVDQIKYLSPRLSSVIQNSLGDVKELD